MAQTRISFSEIGVTSSSNPTRQVMRYPVLWVKNPKTGRCKRFDHLELKDEINKQNYRGLAEAKEFVLIVTDNDYYSFASSDGTLITKVSTDIIRGHIVGVQTEGVLFRDDSKLTLLDKDLKQIACRELTAEEIQQLEDNS